MYYKDCFPLKDSMVDGLTSMMTGWISFVFRDAEKCVMTKKANDMQDQNFRFVEM